MLCNDPKSNSVDIFLEEYLRGIEKGMLFPLYKQFFFFFFFFLAFPSYISEVHHFWVRFLRM